MNLHASTTLSAPGRFHRLHAGGRGCPWERTQSGGHFEALARTVRSCREHQLKTPRGALELDALEQPTIHHLGDRPSRPARGRAFRHLFSDDSRWNDGDPVDHVVTKVVVTLIELEAEHLVPLRFASVTSVGKQCAVGRVCPGPLPPTE